MAGLNGRVRRLEACAGISESEGVRRQFTEERRAEIIAELEAFKARLRRMSDPEREAWLNHPVRRAEFRRLEERVERRRRGGA